jgi:hypothetical protein
MTAPSCSPMLRQDRQVVHRVVAGLTPEQLAFRAV